MTLQPRRRNRAQQPGNAAVSTARNEIFTPTFFTSLARQDTHGVSEEPRPLKLAARLPCLTLPPRYSLFYLLVTADGYAPRNLIEFALTRWPPTSLLDDNSPTPNEWTNWAISYTTQFTSSSIRSKINTSNIEYP